MVSTNNRPVVLSIGIIAWNEERSLPATLQSLFGQSVFKRLCERQQRAEILVVANACTDRTVAVAREIFERAAREHPWAEGFVARVIELKERGKANAWNHFIHEGSAPEARYLCSMDADITFHHADTVHNLMATLETNPHARASTGRQWKDIAFKKNPSLSERISLATSRTSGGNQGYICGQLFCLPVEVARNLYIPRDLGATEDGFIKQMVCTEFLTSEADLSRIPLAPDAAHIFEAYLAPRTVMNNQKRQMIGQTIVHVLIEHLKTFSPQHRRALADTLRREEKRDPVWLKKLVAAHLHRNRYFWRLFPDLLTFRFKPLAEKKGLRRLAYLPVACVGFIVTLIACARAHKALRQGVTDYWPKAERQAARA